MRILIWCFLVLNFQVVFGQILCDSLPLTNQYGDYPPGCTLCSATLIGNNIGYTPDDTISYDFVCGDVENSVWYSFYSRGEGFSALGFVANECSLGNGVEVAVFDKKLKQVGDCISIKDGTFRVLVKSFPARELFYIMIDGIDGDECEFSISPSLTAGEGSEDIYVIPSNSNYCIGAEVCFYRRRDFAFETYQWNVPAVDSIISGGIEEEDICLYFKTSGPKNISLNVSSPCDENDFVSTLYVGDGASLSIESFTLDSDTLCLFEEVRIDVGWKNDSVGLDWNLPGDFFYKTAGGELNDTFCVAQINRGGRAKISVTPKDRCGFRYEQEVDINNNFINSISGLVCLDGCFYVGDSCYAEPNGQRIIAGTRKNGCDSIIQLVLTPGSIFPSPMVECTPTNEGLLIKWQRLSGVEHYVIYSNRDSIATTTGGSFLLENSLISNPLVIKIQPLGECTYLPAEIDCSELVSSTNTNFSNNEIIVYPNPTTGVVNIKTDLLIEEIKIYDTAGRFLQKEITTSFELKYRESGVYFLKIKTHEGVGVKRILVN